MVLEVKIFYNPQTTVYRDVTMRQFNDHPASGSIKVQQVLEPGSLDELDQDSFVTAWGNETGERIIATVLVYTLPR